MPAIQNKYNIVSEVIINVLTSISVYINYFLTENYIEKTPASILYKSIAGRYRPVSYPDGPITARYIFIKNAYWDLT